MRATRPAVASIAAAVASLALLPRFAGTAAAAPVAHVVPAAESTARTVALTVGDRRYRLHVPAGAGSGAPRPLVVAFHGAGSTTRQQERASGLSALADREGFVVVYPEGRARRWTADAADERFVREVVADVARRVAIDPRRVYATGISNGGAMADRMACDLGDVFAAIATVAGVYGPGEACRPARAVPVLAFHGLRDRLAPYGGRTAAPRRTSVTAWASAWAARNACRAGAAVTAHAGLTTRAWHGCGAEVVLVTLASLGHAWPGDPTDPAASASPVDASAAIWTFFAAHPMPSGMPIGLTATASSRAAGR